jgi:hypothetical protein
MLCFGNADIQVMTLLLNAYPDAVEVGDKDSLLPIHAISLKYADDNEFFWIVGLLVAHYLESMSITNRNGDLPIRCALKNW